MDGVTFGLKFVAFEYKFAVVCIWSIHSFFRMNRELLLPVC